MVGLPLFKRIVLLHFCMFPKITVRYFCNSLSGIQTFDIFFPISIFALVDIVFGSLCDCSVLFTPHYLISVVEVKVFSLPGLLCLLISSKSILFVETCFNKASHVWQSHFMESLRFPQS